MDYLDKGRLDSVKKGGCQQCGGEWNFNTRGWFYCYNCEYHMLAARDLQQSYKKENLTARERVVRKLWYEYFLLDRSKEQVSKYYRMIRRDVDKDGNILPPPPRPGENTKYDQKQKKIQASRERTLQNMDF